MASGIPAGVNVLGPIESALFGEILTGGALEFLAGLHRNFNSRRLELLERRTQRQAQFDAGELPNFLEDTRAVREDKTWRVASIPHDLKDRRVEITGPVDRKMVINALNSGAKVFMADFEDALSPTWHNLLDGQVNLRDAIRRKIDYKNPGDGRVYKLREDTENLATLVVRPRGWHLSEKHLLVDGEPISGSLFDFGLYFYHNAKELLHGAISSGPYFYLPKMESHLEARLWNDVFVWAQAQLSIPKGSIRATVLIETILAAFEMEEILYELREHSSGLNAGRWDYLFSMIKKFRNRPDFVLPDRAQLTMTVPFMRAYTELLVSTCHRRGAHAMGGMAAFIPSRRDAEVNARAFAKVREDKQREATDGFDGTWVAHPDLVTIAKEVFDNIMGKDTPNQIETKKREDVRVSATQLIDVKIPDATVTEAGVQINVSAALQYIEAWIKGLGAVGINNLMEDAATAEISRSQIWQWIRHSTTTKEGRKVTKEWVAELLAQETERLASSAAESRARDAKVLLEKVTLCSTEDFPEFLTLPAYEHLLSIKPKATL